MSTTDSRIYKVLLAIAILIIIALGTYTYKTHHENQAIKTALQTEKTKLEKELNNIELEYLAEIEKGSTLTTHLEQARERITRLKDSVKQLEPNLAILKKLRNELVQIKKERKQLITKVQVLQLENNTLSRINDSTIQALNKEIIVSSNKSNTIDKLHKNIEKASSLIPTNFTPKGVIIRSSGKQIENDRAWRVDDLKVCFTLPQNALAATGVQSFYLQVINPDNQVIGLKKKIHFQEQELVYSKIVRFNYTGQELDICELVNAHEDHIKKGTYRINLYNGAIRVSNAQLELR